MPTWTMNDLSDVTAFTARDSACDHYSSEHSGTIVSLQANEDIEINNKRPIAKGMINQHTVRPRTS